MHKTIFQVRLERIQQAVDRCLNSTIARPDEVVERLRSVNKACIFLLQETDKLPNDLDSASATDIRQAKMTIRKVRRFLVSSLDFVLSELLDEASNG